MPNTSALCSEPDEWENNNNPNSANLISANESAQTHNFCNLAVADYMADEDWLKLPVQTGHTYEIRTIPLADSAAATAVELYAADGNTLLASTSPDEFGEETWLIWTADFTGNAYLRLHHIDDRVAGDDVSYQVRVVDYTLRMPFIFVNSGVRIKNFEQNIP